LHFWNTIAVDQNAEKRFGALEVPDNTRCKDSASYPTILRPLRLSRFLTSISALAEKIGQMPTGMHSGGWLKNLTLSEKAKSNDREEE
jgi:hypothetical protein